MGHGPFLLEKICTLSLENEPHAVAKISAQAVKVEVELQELKDRLFFTSSAPQSIHFLQQSFQERDSECVSKYGSNKDVQFTFLFMCLPIWDTKTNCKINSLFWELGMNPVLIADQTLKFWRRKKVQSNHLRTSLGQILIDHT